MQVEPDWYLTSFMTAAFSSSLFYVNALKVEKVEKEFVITYRTDYEKFMLKMKLREKFIMT